MDFHIPTRNDFIRVETPPKAPHGIVLTPVVQAAKNLAELLTAKHPDARAACDKLSPAIDRDMAILATATSPETIKTAEDRLELHQLAMQFILAETRGDTMTTGFGDEDLVAELVSDDFDIPPRPERHR